MLSGQQTARVKQRALFVLGMIDLPEAKTVFVDTARSARGPLQSEAIRALGIRGGKDLAASLGAFAALRKLYAEAGTPRIRDAALSGLMMGGEGALEAIDAALEGKSP